MKNRIFINKFTCLFITLLIISLKTFAQVPANDNCSNARFINLDATGNLCFTITVFFSSAELAPLKNFLIEHGVDLLVRDFLGEDDVITTVVFVN